MMILLNCVSGAPKKVRGIKYGIQDSLTRTNKTLEGGVTQANIGNILEDFKINILGTLTT